MQDEHEKEQAEATERKRRIAELEQGRYDAELGIAERRRHIAELEEQRDKYVAYCARMVAEIEAEIAAAERHRFDIAAEIISIGQG